MAKGVSSMLVDTVRAIQHLPSHGGLTLCALILIAAGARLGLWQMTRQEVTVATRATNEWERTAFLLKDAAVNAVLFGLITAVVIMWARPWLIVPSLFIGAALVVPTVLQDLSLTFSGVLAILSKRTQRVATTASIGVRLTGDLVQVFYVALLLTALVT
jgi:hypothetical protein